MKFLAVGALAVAGVLSFSTPVNAEVVYDFEKPTELTSATLISGDKHHFAVTAEQAHTGTGSMKFVDTGADPHESWTYDMPFEITSGVVSLWFYDVRGQNSAPVIPHVFTWGGSIILEDKNNPNDFGAVEITELNYGGIRYIGTEGLVDRGTPDDRIDSNSFPLRTVGLHKVEFHVTPTETTIYVDTVPTAQVKAPGSTGNNLRLRVMADSPSLGGRAGTNTWYNAPLTKSLFKNNVPWVFYDDLRIDNGSQVDNVTFEVVNDVADYDTAGEFLGVGNEPIAPFDNPNMSGFVNQWSGIDNATAARSGTRVAGFTNPPQPFQSLEFDLTGAQAGTTATIWFYDSLGPNTNRDQAGGSILLEDGNDPTKFVAVEIANYPYPTNLPPTYYLTKPGTGSGIFTKTFVPRAIGWHKVEFLLGDTASQVYVDGVLGTLTGSSGPNPGPVADAPGLNSNPKLRIMADTASNGGFYNWRTLNELQGVYHATRTPYVYYDDISLPVPGPSSVNDWMTY